MIFDIVAILILLVSCGIAFLRGFIREVLTIFGVAGGLAAAFFFGPTLMPLMNNLLGVEDGEEPKRLFDLVPYSFIADVLAYSVVFILVVIVLSLLSHFLSGRVRAIGLGSIDRSLGVFFGLVRGILILAVLYLPLYVLVDEDTRDVWFEGSRTQFYVEKTAAFLSDFIPDDYVSEAKQAAEKEVQEKARSTREKLQEMDMLRRNREENPESPAKNGDTNSGSGYDDNERQNMNELIQDNIEDNLND